MDTIRMPIKFTLNHAVATIIEGTDEFYTALLASAYTIEPQGLPISTGYGVVDPAFNRISEKSVYLASKYVPEITIKKISSKLGEDGTNSLVVIFEHGN